MKMEDILTKARELGVEVHNRDKKDIIRSIQLEEGNFPCFMTCEETCEQKDCCWRSDCLPQK